jgi:uncharacterized membrane protein
MGSEGIPGQKFGGDEANLSAEVAALSARVNALEQQLREMREAASARTQEDTAPILPPAERAVAAQASQAPAGSEIAPPPPPLTIPSFHGTPPPPAVSLESRLGAQVFNRVGIVALLIGATWFLKLAVDNHWIGPVGRILVGLVAGAGLVLWSERFRRKGFAGFSYSLKAIGTGVLYLSL